VYLCGTRSRYFYSKVMLLLTANNTMTRSSRARKLLNIDQDKTTPKQASNVVTFLRPIYPVVHSAVII